MTRVPLLPVAVAAAALTAVLWEGRRRSWERESAASFPVGDDGIIVGAQSIRLGRGGAGLLLLHGFGDTPQSMRALAESLHAAGWTVRVPLLPGHGRTLREFARSRAPDWIAAAGYALAELRGECDSVSLVGQSMGGAIALMLAASSPPVDALVLMAPYLSMTPAAARLARLHRAGSLVVPYIRSAAEHSLLDPGARRAALGFGMTTPRLLHELLVVVTRAQAAATAVRSPTLVVHSTQDHRIPPAAAERAFARLGGRPKTLRWMERSGHVLSADMERDEIAALVAAWLKLHAGAAPTTGTQPAAT